MNENHGSVQVKVKGEFACFTRPEAKVERVSYEVMTPSAARGVLEAIFYHKPMKWRIREIHVLQPICHFSILRNEVKSKMSPRGDGFIAAEDRTQRHTLCLRDVEYVIKADVWLPPGATHRDTGEVLTPIRYREQFQKRLKRGQCFHRPYLGNREFACDFEEPDGTEETWNHSKDLGLMLFDIDYSETRNIPRFFEAKLEKGVLHIPPELYERSTG